MAIFLPDGKGLIVGGKFNIEAEKCCCGCKPCPAGEGNGCEFCHETDPDLNTPSQLRVAFSSDVGTLGCNFETGPPFRVWAFCPNIAGNVYELAQDPSNRCRYFKEWSGGSSPVKIKRCDGDGSGCDACVACDGTDVTEDAVLEAIFDGSPCPRVKLTVTSTDPEIAEQTIMDTIPSGPCSCCEEMQAAILECVEGIWNGLCGDDAFIIIKPC